MAKKINAEAKPEPAANEAAEAKPVVVDEKDFVPPAVDKEIEALKAEMEKLKKQVAEAKDTKAGYKPPKKVFGGS